MVESESKLIGADVYDPRSPSIFGKGKKSKRALFKQIFCECETCPLLAMRQCVLISVLGSRCPHGKRTTETGPTQRARSYYEWVSSHTEIAKKVGWLGFAPKKMAFIGDYVYLPYSHMDMCKPVPFLAHSAFAVSGSPFIKRDDWTIETVLKLVDFHPIAMFGGVIDSYQKSEVPIFLQHIRELDQSMWSQLTAVRPELDTEPNYVGRKALLRTLASPITIPPHDSRYPVAWTWDGETATTDDVNCYERTWGKIDAKSLSLTLKPTEDAVVVVADNSWVKPETVFVD